MTKIINATTDRMRGNASKAVLIASGQTVASEGVNLSGHTLTGVLIPTMTGTSVTFQGSIDGTNYYAIKDATGTAISVTTGGTLGIYKLNPADFAGLNFIKPVSASAEAADRSVTLLCADILND